ncbi:macro domain-like protein [Obba rivulosa]|uniref:Macro domain-like protein n=1 Tax=Obba rivulosa TaxID=1052685 RepID=A0A8E2DMF8_9APHY|nr:macro domain-like protein [Obba rivulosa]
MQLLSPQDQARFSVVESKLEDLEPPSSLFDCVVSPANSYGIMDGGFDYYLSEALSPDRDIMALTRCAQAAIKERYYGFAPPGTCTLVPLAPELRRNPRFPRCRVLAVCPTMRYPQDVHWHKDLVYNTMWSLLVELEHWNERAAPDEKINRVAMTGLATGVGQISKDVCARQMVLAVKHFLNARSEEGRERWGQRDYPNWEDVLPIARELEKKVSL